MSNQMDEQLLKTYSKEPMLLYDPRMDSCMNTFDVDMNNAKIISPGMMTTTHKSLSNCSGNLRSALKSVSSNTKYSQDIRRRYQQSTVPLKPQMARMKLQPAVINSSIYKSNERFNVSSYIYKKQNEKNLRALKQKPSRTSNPFA